MRIFSHSIQYANVILPFYQLKITAQNNPLGNQRVSRGLFATFVPLAHRQK